MSAPAAQSFANYLLLALIFVPTLALTRNRRRRGLRRPKPWHWLLVALADVEGNYLLVLAYRFTDLLSVSLLDAFTVPCVLLLSRCLFGVRYGARQLGAERARPFHEGITLQEPRPRWPSCLHLCPVLPSACGTRPAAAPDSEGAPVCGWCPPPTKTAW